MKSQVLGSVTSDVLSQFSREPGELLWQPNSEKNKPNLHKFLAKNRGIFFAYLVGFYGLREFKCAT